MEKQRDAYWDNLKAILIFLVVVGHFLLPISPKTGSVKAVFSWIYLFHMPAFVFVSGVFSKSYVRKGKKEYKLAGFLALYVFFTVGIWLIELLFGRQIEWTDILSTSSAPWYMLAMFFWFLLLPFVSRLKPGIALPLFLLLGLFVGCFSHCGNFLAISRTIVLFPFFLAGYWFDGSLIGRIRPWMRLPAALFLALCAFLLFRYMDRLAFYVNIMYAKSPYYALGFSNRQGLVYRAVWYCLAASMTAALMCLVSGRRSFLTCVGERTLGIYILHRLLRDVCSFAGMYALLGSSRMRLPVCVLVSAAVLLLASAKPVSAFFNSFFHLDFLFRPAPPSDTEQRQA